MAPTYPASLAGASSSLTTARQINCKAVPSLSLLREEMTNVCQSTVSFTQTKGTSLLTQRLA
jgi:hypothetical protein